MATHAPGCTKHGLQGRSLSVPILFAYLAVSFLMLLAAESLSAQTAEITTLTTARQVHDLPAALAARGLPVHLVGQISYYEPALNTLFFEDATSSVYIKTSHTYPVHRGDVVVVDGFTATSFRTAVARNPRIRVIGHAPLRPATRLAGPFYQQLMAGKWDCQRVTVQGTVRSALLEIRNGVQALEIELLVPGGLIQAYVQDFHGIDPRALIDSEVSISGVAGANFNAKWELMRSVLYAATPDQLQVLRRPLVDLAALPLTPIDQVIQTYDVVDRTPRVRVRGVIAYYRPGHSVVIEQGGKSLFATTRETLPLSVGSVVDLVGFASDSGYGPELGQVEILPTGGHQAVAPVPVSYAQAVTGLFNNDLVSIRGRLISQVHSDSADTLFLLVDDHAVTVELQQPDADRWLPHLPLGSLVAVTGICRITSTGVWGEPGVWPMLFRLDMRSREDVQVLRSPSWWTVSHLLYLVAGLLIISVFITAWAIALRRRVSSQNRRIERAVRLEKERSRLLEAISSKAELAQLLKEICSFAEAFAPRLHCAFRVVRSTETHEGGLRPTSVGETPSHVLFQRVVLDGENCPIGTFMAGVAEPCRSSYGLLSDELEVATVAVELISLAVRQRQMYHELNYTSSHDQLTGLPNRRSAELALDRALQYAVWGGQRIGVVYIDVDRFKQVNDRHGHKTGDLYLQQIALRLSTTVSEAEGDILARIGGDEFLAITPRVCSLEDLETYREAISRAFHEHFELDGVRIEGSASVGIAIYPDHGANVEELKRHADADMYARKRRNGGLGPAADPEAATEMFTVADLEAALEAGRFELHYQPQFSPERTLRGLEALIRLHDPILGLVSPGDFIALAERSGFILQLGLWVLRRALADAKHWGLDRTSGARVVINTSARQLEHPGFADQVLQELEAAGLPAHVLELEITERCAVTHARNVARELSRLREAGICIALDDFGTEHSSLSALHQLPVDTIKIDRSFIRVMASEPEVLAVIQAILQMATCLRKRVVAEGVETEAELYTLLSMGEMDLQGYLLCRPQPGEVIAAHLDEWLAGRSQQPLANAPEIALRR